MCCSQCSAVGWDPDQKFPRQQPQLPECSSSPLKASFREAPERPFGRSYLAKLRGSAAHSWFWAGRCKMNLSPGQKKKALRLLYLRTRPRHSLNTLPACRSARLKCRVPPRWHSLPSVLRSLNTRGSNSPDAKERQRERQHAILHLRAHKQISRYWLEPRPRSHRCPPR